MPVSVLLFKSITLSCSIPLISTKFDYAVDKPNVIIKVFYHFSVFWLSTGLIEIFLTVPDQLEHSADYFNHLNSSYMYQFSP
jgi:hypothetical protein